MNEDSRHWYLEPKSQSFYVIGCEIVYALCSEGDGSIDVFTKFLLEIWISMLQALEWTW